MGKYKRITARGGSVYSRTVTTILDSYNFESRALYRDGYKMVSA